MRDAYNTCCLGDKLVTTPGERIRQRRKEIPRFRRQVDLARALGVPRERVTLWETNKALPEGQYLTKLARELEVSPAWILEGRENTTEVLRDSPSYSAGMRDVVERIEDALHLVKVRLPLEELAALDRARRMREARRALPPDEQTGTSDGDGS